MSQGIDLAREGPAPSLASSNSIKVLHATTDVPMVSCTEFAIEERCHAIEILSTYSFLQNGQSSDFSAKL
jgi:hypothetical protein